MHKKADVSGVKMFLYIGYAFMIAFGFVGFVGTISSISAHSAVIPEGLEVQMITQRALISPYCFAYQDNTGRSYDIIDFNKFSNKTLEHCLNLERFPYDFKFELTIEEEELYFDSTGDYPAERIRFVTKTHSAHTSGWFGIHFEDAYDKSVLVMRDSEMITGNLRIFRQKSSRLYS